MINKKRYIPPYIEFSEIEEDIDMLAGSQEELKPSEEVEQDDSKQSKGSSFNWDTPDTHEWEI